MKMYKSIPSLVFFIAATAVTLFAGGIAEAKVRVVTSTPDFAAIAREIGGDRVDVESLAKGYQDPHFVDAKPIYITKLNRADILVYNGLDLEVETAVAGNLVEHVVEEPDAGVELTLAAAVEIDLDSDLGLEGVAGYFGVPHCVVFQEKQSKLGEQRA